MKPPDTDGFSVSSSSGALRLVLRESSSCSFDAADGNVPDDWDLVSIVLKTKGLGSVEAALAPPDGPVPVVSAFPTPTAPKLNFAPPAGGLPSVFGASGSYSSADRFLFGGADCGGCPNPKLAFVCEVVVLDSSCLVAKENPVTEGGGIPKENAPVFFESVDGVVSGADAGVPNANGALPL